MESVLKIAVGVFIGVLVAGIVMRIIDRFFFKKESFDVQKENYENIDEEERDS
jgi:Na+/glutamate symporter